MAPAGRHGSCSKDQDSRACANSRALKVSRSSSFSPTPMKYTGWGVPAQWRPARRPWRCRPACDHQAGELQCVVKARTCTPARSGRCCRQSPAAPRAGGASALVTTRRIFSAPPSGAAAWAGGRRCPPAPRPCHGPAGGHGVKAHGGGSPPSWLTISTVLRSAHTPSCSRAAARKVSAAASSTLAPSFGQVLGELCQSTWFCPHR